VGVSFGFSLPFSDSSHPRIHGSSPLNNFSFAFQHVQGPLGTTNSVSAVTPSLAPPRIIVPRRDFWGQFRIFFGLFPLSRQAPCFSLASGSNSSWAWTVVIGAYGPWFFPGFYTRSPCMSPPPFRFELCCITFAVIHPPSPGFAGKT